LTGAPTTLATTWRLVRRLAPLLLPHTQLDFLTLVDMSAVYGNLTRQQWPASEREALQAQLTRLVRPSPAPLCKQARTYPSFFVCR